ncbi:Gamma-glutamylcyclotransferase [Temnothorax longispinosus]|uniref:gamma-glutamylcyclotransferase n=1 Tax=Temnothorax longispinosus TaxID=300112 RepID=A0A4S2K5Y3_9HYME|nr:Gamma-glutamylcyclotransferase [Temnothorax longispinosus]
MSNTFLYFAYGSNLFSKRIRLSNPTAVMKNIGYIKIFNSNAKSTLDKQEGVQDDIYHPMTVNVETPDGTTLTCRVYQQCNNPKEYIKPENYPMDRRPSPLYLNMILKGAEENNLPTDYMKFLKTIPHNGYKGEYDVSSV